MTFRSIKQLFPRLAVLSLLIAGLLIIPGCGKKTPEEQFQEAQQLLEERQNSLAILKFKELIEQAPESDPAYDARLELARYYIQRVGDAETGLKYLRQVYEDLALTDQRGFEAFSAIISVYNQTDQEQKAIELAETALEQTEQPELKQPLRMNLMRLKLNSEVEEQNQEAVDYFTDKMLTAEEEVARGEAREILAAHYRQQGEFEKSNEVYRTYLEKFPDDQTVPHLRLAMALNLKASGKAEEAEPLFEKNMEIMMERIEDELNQERKTEKLRMMAQYYELFQEPEKATDVYRRIMQDQPMSQAAIQAQFDIAMVYLRSGELDKAIEVLQQIQEENPNTNIAQTAQRYEQQARQMMEQMTTQEEMPPVQTDDEATS